MNIVGFVLGIKSQENHSKTCICQKFVVILRAKLKEE